MTIGALQAIRARHDRPEPALIGFDDFDTADVLGVTVVSYDPVEMGRRAARVALERIAEPDGFTRQVELPTWIVERGSGERPPAGGADAAGTADAGSTSDAPERARPALEPDPHPPTTTSTTTPSGADR